MVKRSGRNHTVVHASASASRPSGSQYRIALASVVAWWAIPASAQTEAECLSSFAVGPGRSVSYIAEGPEGRFKAPVTMTCADAETFRERLYVSIDKNTYDSEATLRRNLANSSAALDRLGRELNVGLDKIALKAKLSGLAAIVYTPAAVASTAACASAVFDGVGIAACGPAVKSSLTATTAWISLQSFAGDAAALRAAAQVEIGRVQALIAATQQQLDARKARSMKEHYSNLFVAICRAVKEQCLR